MEVARLAEPEVDDAAANPGDEARCVGQVHEPGEDGAAAAAAIEVREHGEAGASEDGVVGHAALVTFLENGGGVAGDGKGVERARGDVEEGVPRRPG